MSASFRPVSDRFSSVGIVCPFKSSPIWKWHTERLKGRRVSSSVKMLCSDPATKKTFKWNRVANRQRMPLLRWSNALSLSFGYANLLRWNRTAYSWRGKIAIPAVYWTLLWKLAVCFCGLHHHFSSYPNCVCADITSAHTAPIGLFTIFE